MIDRVEPGDQVQYPLRGEWRRGVVASKSKRIVRVDDSLDGQRRALRPDDIEVIG